MTNKFQLLELRQVSLGSLYYLPDVERPSTFNNALARVFEQPINKFAEAYTSFMTSVASDATAYDYWVTLVINALTYLGDDYNSVFVKLEALMKVELSSIPGWNSSDLITVDDPSPDYWLLLAMRLYGNFTTDLS